MRLPNPTRPNILAFTLLLAAGAPLAATGTKSHETQIYIYNCGPKNCRVETDSNPEDLIVLRTEGEGLPHSFFPFKKGEPISFELRARDTALLRTSDPRANYFNKFHILSTESTPEMMDSEGLSFNFDYHVIFHPERAGAPPVMHRIKPCISVRETHSWFHYKLDQKATVLVVAMEGSGQKAQVPAEMLTETTLP